MAIAPTSADSLSAWLRLGEALGLAGANAGERRTASSGPESWSGIVEHVHQDAQQRWVLLRLDAPSPGIALIGTHDTAASLVDVEAKIGKAAGTNVSACRYFYGDDVAALAAESEASWRDWLAKTFETDSIGKA